MTWSPVQKLSIGAGSALLVIALFGAAAFASISRLTTQRAEIEDTNDAIAKVDQLLAATGDAERAGSDYMMTGSKDALEAFDQARSRVEDAVDVLRPRSEDRPQQRAALDSLGPLLGRRFTTLSAGIMTRQRKGAEAAVEFARADAERATRGGILPLVERMRDDELRVLAERTRLEALHGRTASTVILVGSLLALVLSLLAFSPIRPGVATRLTRRLSTPMGMASIPELGESMSETSRLAGDRLGRLQQLAYVFDTPDTVEAVGDAILQRGVAAIASAASLVCSFDGGAWHVVARRSTRATVGSALASDAAHPLEDAAKTREPVAIENQAERDKFYPGLPAIGVTHEIAMIAVPFVANGRTNGGLILTFDTPRVFGDDERTYLATLGRMAGQAISRLL